MRERQRFVLQSRSGTDARHTQLTVGLKGEAPVLDGPLWKRIKAGAF